MIKLKKIIKQLQIKYLPIYRNIPLTPYRLCVWNCGEMLWGDIRITIQTRDGLWRATVKEGDYKDEKRISKYFFNETEASL